jgi:hypothetical protein
MLKSFVREDKQNVFLPSGLLMPCYQDEFDGEPVIVIPAVDLEHKVFPFSAKEKQATNVSCKEVMLALDVLGKELDHIESKKEIVITKP